MALDIERDSLTESIHPWIQSQKRVTEGRRLSFQKCSDENRGNIKYAGGNPENCKVLFGQKRKILLEEIVVNGVKALLQSYKKTKENEERKRFGIYFFLRMIEKAVAIG